MDKYEYLSIQILKYSNKSLYNLYIPSMLNFSFTMTVFVSPWCNAGIARPTDSPLHIRQQYCTCNHWPTGIQLFFILIMFSCLFLLYVSFCPSQGIRMWWRMEIHLTGSPVKMRVFISSFSSSVRVAISASRSGFACLVIS